ncbi:MAG TPA: thiol:disulfide interchange protein [Oxalobacteraceae bacterium]|nr:thiol:disulfide interchange protein [Oxalobacteraceae bacterium]
MKSIKLAAIGLLSLACTSALGQSAEEKAVKKLIEPRLGERAKVVSVTRTPYSGLFEVRTDSNDILYTDKKAQYLFVGNIIDTATYENHTKARVDEISKVKFSELPFDSALKMVKGNGKRVIAIFEDPNCGYCKRFRHTLKDMDNVTVYTFMYNILSPDSAVKSKNVWCSADRQKAWDDWMLNNKEPAPAADNCLSNPNEKIFALGQKLKITGTPTIFFTDGSRIPGAVDLKTVEAKLASIK